MSKRRVKRKLIQELESTADSHPAPQPLSMAMVVESVFARANRDLQKCKEMGVDKMALAAVEERILGNPHRAIAFSCLVSDDKRMDFVNRHALWKKNKVDV